MQPIWNGFWLSLDMKFKMWRSCKKNAMAAVTAAATASAQLVTASQSTITVGGNQLKLVSPQPYHISLVLTLYQKMKAPMNNGGSRPMEL